MTPTPRDLGQRLQAIRGALLALEHYCAAHPRDPSLSVLLDHARTKYETSIALLLRRERRGAPMMPSDFDYVSCAFCGEPTPVTLVWMLRPAEGHEPTPPQRYAIHEHCERARALRPASTTPHRDATAAWLDAFGTRVDLDLDDEDDDTAR